MGRTRSRAAAAATRLFGGADGDDIVDQRGPNPSGRWRRHRHHLRLAAARHDPGRPDRDIIRGRGGPDKIDGDAGDDEIFGERWSAGAGSRTGAPGASRRDDLDGGAGDDTISGGPDRDTIRGAGGKDELFGEADNDKLNACDGARDKTVSGGPGGNDVVRRDNDRPVERERGAAPLLTVRRSPGRRSPATKPGWPRPPGRAG